VAEPEVGEIYTGKVVKVVDFGAFVNFFGAKDGLVHISQLANERVAKTNDVVKEGDRGEGQAPGLRRSRQGPPLDEGRFDRMNGLLAYLIEDCCQGRPEVCAPTAEAVSRAACCTPPQKKRARK
jgi:Ribonuclease G/E